MNRDAKEPRRRWVPDVDMRDVIVFGGIALAAYGAFLVFEPAGFVLAGVGLFYVGLWGAR